MNIVSGFIAGIVLAARAIVPGETAPTPARHFASPVFVQEAAKTPLLTMRDRSVLRGKLRLKESDTPEEELKESAPPPPPKKEVNVSPDVFGVYLTPSSAGRESFLQETLKNLSDAGGSAIVVDVKGSYVYFNSKSPLANELDLVRPLYDLPAIIKAAHDNDIYVIGRFIAVKDAGFTARVPASRIYNPERTRVLTQTWIDPEDPTALEYNGQIICELAASGIDEINLDYIRFSTAEVGALRVYSGEAKADKIEKFVVMARNAIDTCGPKTKLGLSTFAILGWNYESNLATLGQDVVRMAPIVDIISPMAYPQTFSVGAYYNPAIHPRSRMYYLVNRTLTGYAELLGEEHTHKIRPWIQGYFTTARDMREQIDAIYDAGLCGYTVWSAGNHYGHTYQAMRTETNRPERCAKPDYPSVKPDWF